MMKSIVGHKRKHDLSFRKDGRIDITARVAKYLDLKDGDVIDIAKDDKDFEYYLYVQHRRDELIGRYDAQCHKTNKRGNNFRCYSSCLCKTILSMCDLKERAFLPVGEPTISNNNTVIVPVILHNLDNNN